SSWANDGRRSMSPVSSPHPSREQLAAFDQGVLRSAEWPAIEEHVAGCTECCKLLETVVDDDLVQRLREAQGVVTLGPEAVETTAPDFVPAAGVELPPELADHPRYRILGVLGAGGMGAVFKAEHKLMERTVALKILKNRWTDSPAAVDRFRREVKAAAR